MPLTQKQHIGLRAAIPLEGAGGDHVAERVASALDEFRRLDVAHDWRSVDEISSAERFRSFVALVRKADAVAAAAAALRAAEEKVATTAAELETAGLALADAIGTLPPALRDEAVLQMMVVRGELDAGREDEAGENYAKGVLELEEIQQAALRAAEIGRVGSAHAEASSPVVVTRPRDLATEWLVRQCAFAWREAGLTLARGPTKDLPSRWEELIKAVFDLAGIEGSGAGLARKVAEYPWDAIDALAALDRSPRE